MSNDINIKLLMQARSFNLNEFNVISVETKKVLNHEIHHFFENGSIKSIKERFLNGINNDEQIIQRILDENLTDEDLVLIHTKALENNYKEEDIKITTDKFYIYHINKYTDDFDWVPIISIDFDSKEIYLNFDLI